MKTRVKLSEVFPSVKGTNKNGLPYHFQEMLFTVVADDGRETTDKLIVTCRDGMYIDNPNFKPGTEGYLFYYANVDKFIRKDGTTSSVQRNVFKGWSSLSSQAQDEAPAATSISEQMAQAAEEKRQEAVNNQPEGTDLPF